MTDIHTNTDTETRRVETGAADAAVVTRSAATDRSTNDRETVTNDANGTNGDGATDDDAEPAGESDEPASGEPTDDDSAPGGAERTNAGLGSYTGEPIDILLVEDNPGDVRLTKEAFRNGRIENTIHVVTDGVEALDFLHQRGEYEDAPTPDVVLLDLNLPRKNGDEVLAELKNDPGLRPIPVIVLTSSKAEEDVVKSYELHANAYLTKPVDPAAFIDTIQSFERFWLSVVRLPPEEEER